MGNVSSKLDGIFDGLVSLPGKRDGTGRAATSLTYDTANRGMGVASPRHVSRCNHNEKIRGEFE
jgi:hypothetical protein